MARDINKIQRGDLQLRLCKTLGIIGETSPAPTLATEVQAVVMLEDASRGDPADVGVERAFSGFAQSTAGAAELAHVQIRNPAGSGVIGVIEKVIFSSSVAGLIDLQYNTTALATAAGTPFYIDSRLGFAPALLVRRENSATAFANQIGQVRVVANGSLILPFDHPLILNEGDGLIVATDVAAVAILSATFLGYEIVKRP